MRKLFVLGLSLLICSVILGCDRSSNQREGVKHDPSNIRSEVSEKQNEIEENRILLVTSKYPGYKGAWTSGKNFTAYYEIDEQKTLYLFDPSNHMQLVNQFSDLPYDKVTMSPISDGFLGLQYDFGNEKTKLEFVDIVTKAKSEVIIEQRINSLTWDDSGIYAILEDWGEERIDLSTLYLLERDGTLQKIHEFPDTQNIVDIYGDWVLVYDYRSGQTIKVNIATNEEFNINISADMYDEQYDFYLRPYSSLFFSSSENVLMGTFPSEDSSTEMSKLEVVIITNDVKTYIGDGVIIGIAKDGFIVSVYENHEYKTYYQPYIGTNKD